VEFYWNLSTRPRFDYCQTH